MRILFFSPHALADSASGAARSVNTLLSELIQLGHECLAVTGSVVDAPNALFTKVLEIPHIAMSKIPELGVAVPVRRVSLQGVTQLITCFRGARITDVLAVEEFALKNQFLTSFSEFQPDVVLTYGGFTSVTVAGLHAMSQGRKSILYAASDTYRQSEQLSHANAVVAVSNVICRQLAGVTPLPKIMIPPFIDKTQVICAERTPEFITFINPSAAKGLKLAAALALECAKRGRAYNFLFVEGRATREAMLKTCPELEGLPTLFVAENTSDIRQIYARTAILLYPSVWFEAAGQICIEANANGIPVLASRVGGIPEMLDGAGYLFDPPQACLENWEAPVPPAYVEKWLDVLDRLHTDPKELQDAERRARVADARYDCRKFARQFAAFAAE